MNEMSVPDATQIARIRAYLASCAAAIVNAVDNDPIRQLALNGSRQLQHALRHAEPLEFVPTTVPVMESLALVRDGLMIDEFKQIAEHLPWKPSFRSDDDGHEMALASINDVFDLGDVVCGFIFVGADCRYPEHQHDPQELYLTLSEGALWRFGGHDHYQRLNSGRVIYNKPWDLHGVRAEKCPSLALYVLWPSTDST